MSYDVRPDSRIDVRDAYAGRPIASGSLTVVVDRDSVSVQDGGVNAHLGPGDVAEVYLGFFVDRLPIEFREQTALNPVLVADADAFAAGAGGLPEVGRRVTFAGEAPDYVLFVRNLRVFRAGYQASGAMVPMAGPSGGMMPLGGGKQMAVRNDADVVLWDNAAGQVVSSGHIESHDEYTFMRPAIYEGAVGEFVEQVVYRTPIAKR